MAFYSLSVFQTPKCKTIQVSQDSNLLQLQATPVNSCSLFVAFTKLWKALFQLAVESGLGLFAVTMFFRFFRFFCLLRSCKKRDI